MGSDSSYMHCANEGGVCNLPRGTQHNVAYGADDKYYFRNYQNIDKIDCTNANFGDPAPGVAKKCYSRPNPEFLIQGDGTPYGFVKCSDENGQCTSKCPGDILYGADGSFVSGFIEAGETIRCTNNVFGYPNIDSESPKTCYFRRNPNIFPSDPINPLTPITPGTPVIPTTPITPVSPVSPFVPNWNPSPVPVNNLPPVCPLQPITPNHPLHPITPYHPLHPITPINNVNATRLQTYSPLTGKYSNFYGWNNTNIPGDNMEKVPMQVLDENACAMHCVDSGCNSYSYNNTSKECWLKKFPAQAGTDSKMFTYTN